MATRTWNTVLNLAGDTEFRAWAQGVIDTLKASNLVQTADSGQLADPVVAARPATGASAGYWVFRMNDAQQANFPLYFKIEVGLGSSASVAQMWVTIGTGTDGAGVITGTRLARTAVTRAGAASVGVTYEHAASWGEGYFNMHFNVGDVGNSGFHFGWDRNRDINGDTKDDCAFFLANVSSSGVVWATLPKPPTGPVGQNGSSLGVPVLFSPGGTAEISSLGGDVPVFPFEPFFGRRQPPLLGMAVVGSIDVGGGVVFTTTMYGAAKTFRRVSGPIAGYSRGSSNSTGTQTSALAIRWE